MKDFLRKFSTNAPFLVTACKIKDFGKQWPASLTFTELIVNEHLLTQSRGIYDVLSGF